MQCFICESNCEYFTSINYFSTAFCSIAIQANLLNVELYKCKHCGSVFSKTHQEMPKHEFEQLMKYGHSYWENIKNTIYSKEINNFPIGTAPHIQEALFLNLLIKNKIVPSENILDYAAGSGHLSNILQKYFSIIIKNYEPFAQDTKINYMSSQALTQYPLILNCAMFQCLTSLESFIHLCSLLTKNGSLFLQTMVKETITIEYLKHIFYTPLCTAAPTNKGMQILMDRFGFTSSCYSPNAKTWLLLRKDYDKERFLSINHELLSNELIYKKGFVDYWK